MMTVTEKVAYLKGLVEGLDFDADKKETKVINAVLDILEDLALAVSDLDDEMAVVTEQLDAVDEDLADLEEVFYEELDDCDCDCDWINDDDDDDDDDDDGGGGGIADNRDKAREVVEKRLLSPFPTLRLLRLPLPCS